MARMITKSLPCRLNDKEKNDRTRDLVLVLDEVDAMKSSEADRKKAAKKAIDEKVKEGNKLRSQVSSGVETREVRCEERRNEQTKTMDVIRLDDRSAWIDNVEIVNSRPLSPQEQQIELLDNHRRDRDATIPADEKDAQPADATANAFDGIEDDAEDEDEEDDDSGDEEEDEAAETAKAETPKRKPRRSPALINKG